MPTKVGPKTVKQGLTFSFNTKDIKNSYLGKPIVNYISTIGDPTEVMPRGEFGQYYNLVPIFETYGLIPYTLSMEIKGNIFGDCFVYMQNGSYTKYGFVGASVTLTTEWQRFVFPNITPSGPDATWQANTPGDHRAMLATYTTYGTGRNPTVRNVQIEAGPYVSPFTAGTRSTTESLKDLTGNTTITLTNLSYGSLGQIVFDGTDDYLTLSSGFYPTSSCSVEFVFRHTNNLVGSKYLLYGAGGIGFTIFMRGDWAGDLLYFLRRVTNSGNYGDSAWGYTTGIYYSAPANETIHFIFTHEAGTGQFKCYKNGVLVRTIDGNLKDSGGLNTSQATHYIGGTPGENFPMSLPVFKVYNRVLLASEVQENFNAIKTQHSI